VPWCARSLVAIIPRIMPFLIVLLILGASIGLFASWRRVSRRGAGRARELEQANSALQAAKAELQRRWQYLAEAQRLSHAGTFGWQVGGEDLVWSDETYRILGYTRETNPTLERVFDRVHPDDLDRVRALSDHARETGTDLDVEHRIVLPDGSIKTLHAVAHAGRDSSGNLEYMGVVTDITERRRAEEELRESKARLEEAQRVAHVGHWEWNLETNAVIWSAETYRIYGLAPRESPMDITAIGDMIHPDDREFVFRTADETLRTGVRPNAEHRIVRPTGEVRTVHSQGDVKRDAAGRPYVMFGTVQDITDRKRAEEILRQTQFYLSEGQRLAHIGSWATNDSERYFSDELYRMCGLDSRNGTPTDEQFLSLIHPQDRPSWVETIRAMDEEGSGCDMTMRIVRPDGELRYIRWVGTPTIEHGECKGCLGTAIDVTEQELLTQELRREQAYLAEAQHFTHTGSWAWNVVTREIYHSSDEDARLYGFDPSAGVIPWERVYATILAEDEPRIREQLESALRAGEDYEIEFRIRRHDDGTIRFLRAVGHHVASGQPGDYVGTTMDVTDRKHAEVERERLRQLEADLAHINRVNTLGELAAALAHEIKQPIAASVTSANACLRWLTRDPPDLDKARAAASRIARDGNRAADVINRLQSFYKKGARPERAMVDLSDVIREMTVLLRTEAVRSSVAIHSEIDRDLPTVLADRVQVQQVLMNLMLNAIEAMADTGGDLTIAARSHPEGQIIVTISDTGVGLPPDSTERIFDAFHSTKPQGTGMGLAITRSIVEAHGGRVWAAANEGAGATFSFTLPIASGAGRQ
jgi:PAS domain S-box-containing protein